MSDSGCCGSDCGCQGRDQVTRRDLVKFAGLSSAAVLLGELPAMAGPFTTADFEKLIPSDKKLDPKWTASLFARGEPQVYRGRDLRFIGMPVGGLFCGTVYLGGDGRLWLWDIFNSNRNGILPAPIQFRGAAMDAISGSAYVQPGVVDELQVLDQGFTIAVKTASGTIERPLDRNGFADVSFVGQYPIGRIRYADPAMPVVVTLEAFSPFTPLDVDDSSLPVTILAFHIENTDSERIEVELIGRLENAACRGPQYWEGTRRNELIRGKDATILHGSVYPHTEHRTPRPEIVFEEWSKADYEGWQVEGTAFGKGPIARKDFPPYQGDVGGPTQRVVNSHASAPGDEVGGKDGSTGKLTSKPFTIERRFIIFWIGGGPHPAKTCMNLLVDGKVVRTATGRSENRLTQQWWTVRDLERKQAILEIVDDEKAGWGNIGVGRIAMSDVPPDARLPEEQGDFGTMALTLLGGPADIDSGNAETDLDRKLVGRLGRRLTLEAGQKTDVTFAIAWHFPNMGIMEKNRRHYVARFKTAAEVAAYTVKNIDRLAGQTRLWCDTWYDSTLPHWFLDRTFANTCNLATTTCHRFEDGRFWAWEGVGCCAGTCTHVWHYAHALARIFPQIERDQRERVDFGLALRKDGVMRFRAEHNDTFAADGQSGRILGAYREHLMSADDAFLRRIWPNVKRATQRLMQADPKQDGLLVGPLHNTLDADWFGYVPWLCGLYHAALRAAEQMARLVGDTDFAGACQTILDVAARNLDAKCWSDDHGYYIHHGDPAHMEQVGAYEGCQIDQVFGQSWAWQVGLAPVMTASRVRNALQALWRFNFTPDVGPWRQEKKAGRWYALAGDGGLIMTTFPYGGDRKFGGDGAWSAGYFNECMSGFEHQVASHMMWEGMVLESLAITRAIHDRYSGRLRNPYNEVECSDHYARAMASYGTFLAACGFEYDGPAGHIGFAPRMGDGQGQEQKKEEGGQDAHPPRGFRAAFTAAEGWGTFSESSEAEGMRAKLEVKWGRLQLRSMSLSLAGEVRTVEVKLGGKPLAVSHEIGVGRVAITLETKQVVGASETLEVLIRTT